MESYSLLEKIKSKYVINNIFNYLCDGNYKFNLAKYCKRLQIFFKLGEEDYKAKSIEFINNYIKFENYLYVKRSSKFKKDYLKNIYNEDLKQYNEQVRNNVSNQFSEIYFRNKYEYYQNNEPIKKNILDKQFIIDIQSPFYEYLSKKQIFENLFIIRIPLPLIEENNLMKDYILEFEKLNKSNTNYSALCFQFDTKTLRNTDNQNYNFNIDYKKIKKLIFEEKEPKVYTYRFKTKINELLLFKTIFEDNDAVNNLISLEIKILRNKKFEYDLDNINSFKSLEELKLENVLISEVSLKLNTLKYLALCNCNRIRISKNCALHLKSVSLFRSTLINYNIIYKLQFPELEQLKISFCFYKNYDYFFKSPTLWYRKFGELIDFKSLKKLKYLFRGDISLFLQLNNNSLEKAYISSYAKFDKEKEMIKKFIEIKTLKEIKLNLYYINSDELETIEGENTSVKKLIIDIQKQMYENDNEKNNNNVLYNLQKKFPNIMEIEIYDCFSSINKINLDLNSKIERLKYSRGINNFYVFVSKKEISINSFEHLKDLEIRNANKINIPIFNDNCDCDFKSLIKFQLDNSNKIRDTIDIKMINNIIRNIKKMPNLKFFIFKCYSNINEQEYNDLIKKLLTLKNKIH